MRLFFWVNKAGGIRLWYKSHPDYLQKKNHLEIRIKNKEKRNQNKKIRKAKKTLKQKIPGNKTIKKNSQKLALSRINFLEIVISNEIRGRIYPPIPKHLKEQIYPGNESQWAKGQPEYNGIYQAALKHHKVRLKRAQKRAERIASVKVEYKNNKQ